MFSIFRCNGLLYHLTVYTAFIIWLQGHRSVPVNRHKSSVWPMSTDIMR